MAFISHAPTAAGELAGEMSGTTATATGAAGLLALARDRTAP